MSIPIVETLFTPAEHGALAARDLRRTACVVFDVLRATSTMVTALARGARALIPALDIAEALRWKLADPAILLAGEREGLRIGPELTGGLAFDLGNSPREFTRTRIAGKTIAITTTNGTRALRACHAARTVYAASFLNLSATANHLKEQPPERLLLVCSGTAEEFSYEDTLGAGALLACLPEAWREAESDSSRAARDLYLARRGDLRQAFEGSRNGRRLAAIPALAPDLEFCLRIDSRPLAAGLREGRLVDLGRA